jgi:hypothetical protein
MIDFEIKNIDEFITEVNTLTATPESKLKAIAEKIQYEIELNLMKGIDCTGSPVAPLKQSTILRKGSNRIFYETGLLVHSVELKKLSLQEFQVQISEQRKEIATYLHFGTKKMPSRPFFGINNNALNEIEKILAS